MRPDRIPLARPDTQSDPARSFFRAITAQTLERLGGNLRNSLAEKIVTDTWPRDMAALTIVRAAASPATIATSAWAGTLSIPGVAEFLSALAPQSAAARLFQLIANINLDGIREASLPRMSTLTGPVFVEEGQPLPLVQGAVAAATLGPPRKMGFLSCCTGELDRYSAESAVTVIRTAMQEATGTALDAAVFGTSAASAARPAGLLNGVTPLTATSGGGLNAATGDGKLLVGAIADAGLGANVVIIANVRQAIALKMLAPGLDIPVLPTTALASGSIAMIDLNGIATGFSATPRIEASRDVGALHFEDTAPLEIASAGTPNTIAAPVFSIWQSNLIALKLVLRAAWVRRVPGSVQVINNATW